MIIVALTGSIGMGKSTVLQMFADLGAAVWNADAAVHRLYAKDGVAVRPVAEAFPSVIANGAIDRDNLSKVVLGDPAKLKQLESIVHPLVAADREEFVAKARAAGAEIAVLDIPLLFENRGESAFDAVIVVSAPASVQRERVLARAGMTEEKFAAILSRQTPDAEKRARADFIIDTGQSLEETRGEVARIVRALRAGGES